MKVLVACEESGVVREAFRKLIISAKNTYNGTACWTFGKGRYSLLVINRKRFTAHRIMYQYYYHKIDSNMVIDHLCNNKACCNPLHLEQVSQSLNMKRSYNNKYSKV